MCCLPKKRCYATATALLQHASVSSSEDSMRVFFSCAVVGFTRRAAGSEAEMHGECQTHRSPLLLPLHLRGFAGQSHCPKSV